MTLKIKISKRTKTLSHQDFFYLLDFFITANSKGMRTQKNGKRIKHETNYKYINLKRLLSVFCKEKQFEMKLYLVNNLTRAENNNAKKYWVEFYKKFTSFLYDDKKYIDNYVSINIKSLRVFFNYLQIDLNIPVGNFHKQFYVFTEQIQIVVLRPEQLNYLIYDEDLNARLDPSLLIIKDLFVFGCTVALRFSDLMSLKPHNVECVNGNYYLKVKSNKTGVYTSVKLPNYAIDIIDKYKHLKKSLLPVLSNSYFNLKLKELGKYICNSEVMPKLRERRGRPEVIYKNNREKTHYTMADYITTHTMRRTGITTLLSMGVPEHMVRKVSGHAPNSKEFFRYVELSQKYLDEATDQAFSKLLNVKPLQKETF